MTDNLSERLDAVLADLPEEAWSITQLLPLVGAMMTPARTLGWLVLDRLLPLVGAMMTPDLPPAGGALVFVAAPRRGDDDRSPRHGAGQGRSRCCPS